MQALYVLCILYILKNNNNQPNLFTDFITECVHNINKIFNSEVATTDTHVRNEYGYIASFLNSKDKELTVENVKQNPLLLAQFENMFIQAIKSHVVVEEKSNVSGASEVRFVKKQTLIIKS